MAFEPLDHGGSAALVRAHDTAQVLGIEPRGKLGRADQVTEEHGQLSTFGLERPRVPAIGSEIAGSPPLVEHGDGCQELAAMPDRGDAEGAQVVGGQPRQHLGVDVVGLERLDIILQAQVPQPARDVHARRPG